MVASYGHTTIPRHLRDIVVTEYGIADLRGRTDAEVVAAMLNVADSRFQGALLDEAKTAGKIAADYQIPPAHRNNTPERMEAALGDARKRGILPLFPFGSDFTAEEQRLMPALGLLRNAGRGGLFKLALCGGAETAEARAALERMGLPAPAASRTGFTGACCLPRWPAPSPEPRPQGREVSLPCRTAQKIPENCGIWGRAPWIRDTGSHI